MLFQLYGETAGYQLLGFVLVFTGLVLANEFARRTKTGGIICFLALPAVLTVYFIAIYIGAANGAEWALNNQTYTNMNSWFHYAKLYAATAGCIGFMMLKYKWSIGKTDWFKVFPFAIVAINILIAVASDFESAIHGAAAMKEFGDLGLHHRLRYLELLLHLQLPAHPLLVLRSGAAAGPHLCQPLLEQGRLDPEPC